MQIKKKNHKIISSRSAQALPLCSKFTPSSTMTLNTSITEANNTIRFTKNP